MDKYFCQDIQTLIERYAIPLSQEAKSLMDKNEIILATQVYHEALRDDTEPDLDEVRYQLAIIYCYYLSKDKDKNIEYAIELCKQCKSFKATTLEIQILNRWASGDIADEQALYPTTNTSDGGYLRFMHCYISRYCVSHSSQRVYNDKSIPNYQRYGVEKTNILNLAQKGDPRAINLVWFCGLLD